MCPSSRQVDKVLVEVYRGGKHSRIGKGYISEKQQTVILFILLFEIGRSEVAFSELRSGWYFSILVRVPPNRGKSLDRE